MTHLRRQHTYTYRCVHIYIDLTIIQMGKLTLRVRVAVN